MTGDGFLLAADAGATLRDMEMVQFFPIAHLYPPLVQLDPIMWDPFRYKLGGRLLNGRGDEFLDESGDASGAYTTPRDTATYKIFHEVEAGRGSPHGGVYLDFRMIEPGALKAGFGPVIDILARQGIDLTRDMVEVSPMAHFMLGGIVVDTAMRTGVEGLLACGEAIGGMHGANRLSGNAITEALVSGRIAGETAGARRGLPRAPIADALARGVGRAAGVLASARREARRSVDRRVQGALAANDVGRSGSVAHRRDARSDAARHPGASMRRAPMLRSRRMRAFALNLQEKAELRIMLAVAEAIVIAGDRAARIARRPHSARLSGAG